MNFSPIQYDEPLFRPPAEANSAILQVTTGCSWNKCAFCEMYTSKQFKIKSTDNVIQDIRILSQIYARHKKIFLADGNAFVLSATKLIPILKELNACFGRIQRISSYALPLDILNKSLEELMEMRALGLKLLYIGIESGYDMLLKLHNKSETHQSTAEGILKAHECGIDTSVMILTGLGGKEHAEIHAEQSANLITELQPKFLSTLTLSFPYGLDHFRKRYVHSYSPQTTHNLLDEMKIFIQNIEGKNIIYRSDHVSNQVILKGTLSRDNNKLISMLNRAKELIPENLYPESPSLL